MRPRKTDNKSWWIIAALLLFSIALPLSCDTVESEATIEGVVVNGETEQVVSGAFVRAIGFPESTDSDSAGKYELTISIDDPEVTTATIEISKSGFFADTLINIGLELGGIVTAPPASLFPIATKSGQVILTGYAVNGVSKESLQGAFVRVFDHATDSVETNSSGRYELKFDIDAGDSISVTVEVSKAGFKPDTVSNVGLSFTDTVFVRTANLIPITDVAGEFTVFGQVVDGFSGFPLGGSLIRALNHSETAESNVNGEYYLHLTLEAGESNVVTLDVSKATFVPDTIRNVGLALGDTVIAPVASLLPLTVKAGVAGISGNVINGLTNAPIENAHARALEHPEFDFTDANGNYLFSVSLAENETNIVDITIVKAGFLTFTLLNVALSVGDTTVAPPANLIPIQPEDVEAKIVGRVTDDILNESLDGVLVTVLDREESAVTDLNGNYELDIVIAFDEKDTVDIEFFKSGFEVDTRFDLALNIGGTLTIPDVLLTPIDRAGPPSNITILSVSSTSIGLKGTGGIETADITFLLSDATGKPLDRFRPTDVSFSSSGPGGGEFVAPATATSDENGTVMTTLNSGTIAGPVQVVATIAGPAISSLPVPISIHGGLPDAAHFSLASSTLNIAGLVGFGREAVITAFVGDKFSNIVPPGTSIQFQSSHGIVEGSAVTDANGRASVTLISANPLPTGADSGFVTVTGETIDENGAIIPASTIVLFSGHTTVNMVGFAGTFSIADGGSETFTFRVRDVENDRPLEGGSTITVSTNFGLLSGDIGVTIPDTQDRGPKNTSFTFTLTDTEPLEDPDVITNTKVTILVLSPNGNVQITISGTVD